MHKEMLTINQLANIADAETSFILRAIIKGELDAIRDENGDLRVNFDDCLDWIDTQYFRYLTDELDYEWNMNSPAVAVRRAYDFGYIEPLIQQDMTKRVCYDFSFKVEADE